MKSAITIDGMHCNRCAEAMARAIRRLEGVEHVEVSLEDHRAVIEHAVGVPPIDRVLAAIQEEGYGATAE